VTWKSIVGTNVAADALESASPGVVGGALIVVGEDYGEGASVIQERTHAYALKSTLLLLDPRPELANMVRCVEHAFALARRATCRRSWSCASAPATCAAASPARTTSPPSSRRAP
jgi:TPP-dependent indolepyruvate ferredoxin oxidoreductase alpha subunit